MVALIPDWTTQQIRVGWISVMLTVSLHFDLGYLLLL